MPRTGIRLVTRGDDSGSCATANQAILDAHRRGILKNTSLMVPGPALDDAVELFVDIPTLCIGLHITLNAEWSTVRWGPILPPERVSSLIDANGHFTYKPADLLERSANPEQAMAEIQAQLDLARSRGLNVEYLDEHMGVGRVLGIQDRLRQFAAREGLVYLPPASRFERSAEDDTRPPAEKLLSDLQEAEPGTYLIVGHPGYDEEDMRAFALPGQERGIIARQRVHERLLFMDPNVVSCCRNRNIQPIRYTEIDTA